MAGIGFTYNYASKAGSGLGGKTYILALDMDAGNVTQAALDAIVAAVTTGVDQGGGKADAFTVAGIAGAVGDATVYLAVQGTGTITTDSSDAFGVTGTNITVTATFAPAL